MCGRRPFWGVVLGEMLLSHVVLSSACEIADTCYYRTGWGVQSFTYLIIYLLDYLLISLIIYLVLMSWEIPTEVA